MPHKNRNIGIVEWKVNGGRGDYPLFEGFQLVGIFEAKGQKKNIPGILEGQIKTYARNIYQHENETITPTTWEYKVPFIYATNGRPYLRRLQDDSGIF